MLASISKSTRKHYRCTLTRWLVFSQEKKINPYSPKAREVIAFLTKRFNEGSSYSTLNSDRCAIALIANNNIGEDKLVSRFIKGCFKLRPTRPRYPVTRDVEIVLSYIENMEDNNDLSLKDLTHKTAILFKDKIIIIITDLLKTSRPGVQNPQVCLRTFTDRPKLCVVNAIKKYLDRTKNIRGKETRLFISIVSPHVAVGTQTLARWIKTMMNRAGVDVEMFKAHSTRHAATSAAFTRGLSIDKIKESADWSEKSQMFAKHYNRTIVNDKNNFAFTVLSKWKHKKL